MPRHAGVEQLVGLIDEACDRPAWHGPNLRAALRGLDAKSAAQRPRPGCHNAWEEAVHAGQIQLLRRLLG